MAVYKVIQDIEAEDKLLGPLTLKGLVYAMIAGFLAFIEIRLLISGAPGLIKLGVFLVLLFPIILFGVLASPLGRDQPTEVWLLSHIKFLLQPRKRIWDQSGISELVTITVPKKVERYLTKDLTPKEVDSRLKALATTLDSRGWAVKNVNINLDANPEGKAIEPQSDRLVSVKDLPQQKPVIEVHASDDIMDEESNPTAKKFQKLITQADIDRKQTLLNKVKNYRAEDEDKESASPLPAEDHEEHKARTRLAQHLASKANTAEKHSPKPKVTEEDRIAKLELSKSGNDLSVASIAQLANRTPVSQTSPGEVVVQLHEHKQQ
jgi:hypothetical protein